jgi:hypothetical protein
MVLDGIWVLIILVSLIWISRLKDGEKEWGSYPEYLKPKRIKEKRSINIKARLRRKLRNLFNFLFTDKEYK